MDGVTETGTTASADAARAAERERDWAGGKAAMAALGLLVLAVATDRLGVRVGGLNVRIAAALVCWGPDSSRAPATLLAVLSLKSDARCGR